MAITSGLSSTPGCSAAIISYLSVSFLSQDGAYLLHMVALHEYLASTG